MLAIVGERDAVLTAEVMKRACFAWSPSAKLEVMANAGHHSMDETPIALATAIERNLAG